MRDRPATLREVVSVTLRTEIKAHRPAPTSNHISNDHFLGKNVRRARESPNVRQYSLEHGWIGCREKGVRHGIALAKALNAKVTVITVSEPQEVDYGGGHDSGWIPSQEEVDSFDSARKERAGKVLDEARAMAEQIGISAELLHVPNAYPATAIIETAKSRGCDLIVMASHGRRGLRKLFLGSQTSEVLADGSVPVLVVGSGHKSSIRRTAPRRPG